MKARRKNRVMAKLRTGNDPILSTICTLVDKADNVSGMIRDMMHILTNNENGVGLAAPQAGHAKRILIMKELSHSFLVMINPVIVGQMPETATKTEYCLSYPGIGRNIKRHLNILVRYSSERGTLIESDFTGFQARIIQHEIDHLNGKCAVKP